MWNICKCMSFLLNYRYLLKAPPGQPHQNHEKTTTFWLLDCCILLITIRCLDLQENEYWQSDTYILMRLPWGGLSAEDKGRSCGKGWLGSLWGRKSNHYWLMSWPVVVRTPTSSGNYSWPVLLRFVTSTGSFYVRRCYLPPMTAGCSINSCKSALYVLLASLHFACFEPIEKQPAQPHLSGWAGRTVWSVR